MTFQIVLALVMSAMLVLLLVAQIVLFVRCYKKAPPGHALVRTGHGGPSVSFNALLCLPLIHQLDLISLQAIQLTDPAGGTTLVVKPTPTAENLLRVRDTLGCRPHPEVQPLLQAIIDSAHRDGVAFDAALSAVGYERVV